MKKNKVIVLMGGKTSEFEVSLSTGREVVKHLNPRKYEVFPIVISKDGRNWELKKVEEILLSSPRLPKTARAGQKQGKRNLLRKETDLDRPLMDTRADVVFIAMHGPFGEDGTIQGMLELAGIPYTGAGVLASALGMDKPMFRKIMEREGITVPKYLVVNKGQKKTQIWKKFKLPVVVKPSSQGSSVGVSLVRSKSQIQKALNLAFSFGQKVLVEEYLSGTEVTCGVLGNKNPFALPVVEIIPKKDFFDYEAKYQSGMSQEIVPARISQKLTQEVQKTAVKVYKAIGCRGFGRIDMIIKKNQVYVLEINTIPGLTPYSLLPKEAAAAGIPYSRLLDKIIGYALEND